MVDHRTRETRSKLSYFFWGGVAMAFGSGVLLAMAVRGTGGAAYFATILAYLLFAAASILMSIAIIGWGVWLGLNAAGLWPGDDTPTPIRTAHSTAQSTTQSATQSATQSTTQHSTTSPRNPLGATEPPQPRPLSDVTPLDPSL